MIGKGPHHYRALELLERGARELRDGEDPIPTITEALANLRADEGEMAQDDIDELIQLFSDDHDERAEGSAGVAARWPLTGRGWI